MASLNELGNSQFSYAAGASGSVTVPASVVVTGFGCHASADGATLTITPKGALQNGAAGPAIPVPNGTSLASGALQGLGQLGPGSIFAFAGTDSAVERATLSREGLAGDPPARADRRLVGRIGPPTAPPAWRPRWTPWPSSSPSTAP